MIAITGAIVASWAGGGLVATLLSTGLDAETKVAAVRDFVLGAGRFAPLLYVAAVTVEVVVAPLPGLMLYAPGGVIFGGFWGGVLSLLGNVLGAAIAFAIVRALGRDAIARRLGDSVLSGLEERLSRHGLSIVFLLRVNPLTSSDLVSYAAGMTSMPAWKLIVGTALGMAPLCFAQSYAAEGLIERFPWLVYAVVAMALIYIAAVVVLISGLRRSGSGTGAQA